MASPQFIRNCSSAIAFTCLVWDWTMTAHQEFKYIWKSRSTAVKWIYLFSRYSAGFGSHLGNLVFLIGPLSAPSISLQSCQAWLLLHTGIFVVQFAALEILLALRIHALYNGCRMIFSLLCATLVTAVSVLATCSVSAVIHLHYDRDCIGSEPPKSFGFIWSVMIRASSDFQRHSLDSVTVVTTQGLMWGLTIHKKRAAERDGWSNVPLMRLIIRDDAIVSICVIAIALAIQPYAFTMSILPHFMCLWPNTLLTIFTCRVILNLMDLKPDTSKADGSYQRNVELTTVIATA